MFSLEEEERTESQGHFTEAGICLALTRSSIKGEQAILRAIASCSDYWLPPRAAWRMHDSGPQKRGEEYTRECDLARATFCLLMATMSDKERKGLR